MTAGVVASKVREKRLKDEQLVAKFSMLLLILMIARPCRPMWTSETSEDYRKPSMFEPEDR